jgi:hypothetical protein
MHECFEGIEGFEGIFKNKKLLNSTLQSYPHITQVTNTQLRH